MAKLMAVRGETGESEFPVGDVAVLGRGLDCDVVFDEVSVSRQHARVTRRRDIYYIEDLNSANGTFVNGRRARRAQLRDGDVIMLGECQVAFVLEEEHVTRQDVMVETASTLTVVDSVGIDEAAEPQEADDASPAGRLRQRLEVVKDVADRCCGMLETDRLVELVLRQLLGIYEQADHVHAVLVGLGESEDDLRLSVARAEARSSDVGISRTLFEMATVQRRAMLVVDVTADSQLQATESIVQQNLHSMMCCPLAFGPRVLGAIQVDTTRPGIPFTGEDLELLAAIAGQVAVAAENSRLHRQVVAQQRLAAVGEAIAGLAHCIKNVLNGLQGGSYILDLGIQKQEPERIAKGWEMVKRNSSFMADLVKDMLAYCRRSGLRREPTNIARLLNETLLMVKEAAAQKGIETSLDVDGEPPVGDVDGAGMKRVVLNLLTNAIDACPEGCHVKLVTSLDGESNELKITVRDDGPGIPDEVKERLFEPFFTTKGSRGTGLGLALVRKVVEEHKGRVELESEPGQGAAFHISIPLTWSEDRTAMA